MPTVTSTTLSAAITNTAKTLTVASATGISAPSGNADKGTILCIGQGPAEMEQLPVTSVSGTTIGVKRGWASTARAWPSGQRVWLGGTDGQIFAEEPQGAQTTTTNLYLPRLVPRHGSVWNVVNGMWTKVDLGARSTVVTVGTVPSTVVAEEFGTGNQHITKLTITNLNLGNPAGAANLAIGALAYTFPAGALVVRACSTSLALTNTDGNIDADTPDVGVGTVVGSGAVAVLGGTATFENIMTGAAATNCTGTVDVRTVGTVLAIPAASVHTVYLNAADGWAGAEATGLIANGTMWLQWDLLASGA